MHSLAEMLRIAAGRGATGVVVETGQPPVFATVRGEEPIGEEISEGALIELLTGVLSNEQQVELAVGNAVEFELDEGGHAWKLVSEPSADGMRVRAWRSNANGGRGISRGGGVELPPAVPHAITDDHSTPPPSAKSSADFSIGAVALADDVELSIDMAGDTESDWEVPDEPAATPAPSSRAAADGAPRRERASTPPPATSASSGAFAFAGMPLDDDEFEESSDSFGTEALPGGTSDEIEIGLGFSAGADGRRKSTTAEMLRAGFESESGFAFTPPPRAEPRSSPIPRRAPTTNTPLPPPAPLGTAPLPPPPGFAARMPAASSPSTWPTPPDTPKVAAPALVQERGGVASAAEPTGATIAGRDRLGELARQFPEGAICFARDAELALALVSAFEGVPVVVRRADELVSMEEERTFAFLLDDPSAHLAWILRRVEEGARVVIVSRARTPSGAERALLGVHAGELAREWLRHHPRFVLVATADGPALAGIE